MKIRLVITILLVSACSLFAADPTVGNLTFQQRTDGSLIVNIEYDLSITDTETEKVKITVAASDDGGTTWDLVCSSLTGDVGDNITENGHKAIVWDFYADNPGVESDQCIVRATAQEFGTMTDYDGNTYQTVKIGDQWWMAENLKVTHYSNGKPIAFHFNDRDWSAVEFGAFAYYNNDSSNGTDYGCLYNWYAVNDSYGLAPSGWHVPTDAEWTTLTDYLGSAAGSKLAGNAALWHDGGLENNAAFGESGFSALPAGYRDDYTGSFLNLGDYAYFWSATEENSNYAWIRYLYSSYSEVNRNGHLKNYGLSVRLAHD